MERTREMQRYLARLVARRTLAVEGTRDVVRMVRSQAWRRLQERIGHAEHVLYCGGQRNTVCGHCRRIGSDHEVSR